MIPSSHPYWHVRSLVQKNSEISALSMSYYIYQPRNVSEKRDTWAISSSDFLNEDFVSKKIDLVPPTAELALNSEFLCSDGKVYHLIMIDMATGAKAHLDKLRSFLDNNLFGGIAWFNSGRSFHGYGTELLSHEQWVKFMGLLLLANLPNAVPTVDPRWIGHRLLAGYAALRWTKNSHFYKSVPYRLDDSLTLKGSAKSDDELGGRFNLYKSDN